MPLPKGGGFFALYGLFNRVGHVGGDAGGGGTWGKRGRMWATRKRPIAGTLVNQVGVWLLVYHTGAHLNGTIQRGAELYQDQTVSTAVLGVERLQNQVG